MFGHSSSQRQQWRPWHKKFSCYSFQSCPKTCRSRVLFKTWWRQRDLGVCLECCLCSFTWWVNISVCLWKHVTSLGNNVKSNSILATSSFQKIPPYKQCRHARNLTSNKVDKGAHTLQDKNSTRQYWNRVSIDPDPRRNSAKVFLHLKQTLRTATQQEKKKLTIWGQGVWGQFSNVKNI